MTPLARLLRERIARGGPIPVEEYMSLALGHPEHGYYMRREPFGGAGDFITAPEISQVFGEVLGLWCTDLWLRAGQPRPAQLVELGPGRGTLMVDALRAALAVPGFLDAVRVHLVETSPRLVRQQAAALADREVTWQTDIAAVPDGPCLILANEFFDALPVRQLLRTADGWAERCVNWTAAEESFGFCPGAKLEDPALPTAAAGGTVCERRPAAAALMAPVAQRLSRTGGALLVLDYGYFPAGFGNTLQAVKAHRPIDPLATPGEADLTAHVDFAALADAARHGGARVYGPIPQGDFLRRLGAEARVAALRQNADSAQNRALVAGLQRLVDPAQMGTLFKAMCVADPAWPAPDGFPDV